MVLFSFRCPLELYNLGEKKKRIAFAGKIGGEKQNRLSFI